ncbi:hypothetical protein NDU88_006340 [Pleurodeles waltl]|uniref:Uncharacterized protein n=1 Tax=Pleurodeles waltl TaxID=8319 RepID=A0AAV7QHR9_PLEWA|nr:hypothetical protein NDU88_006340 [Pleurodeles waltl]
MSRRARRHHDPIVLWLVRLLESDDVNMVCTLAVASASCGASQLSSRRETTAHEAGSRETSPTPSLKTPVQQLTSIIKKYRMCHPSALQIFTRLRRSLDCNSAVSARAEDV